MIVCLNMIAHREWNRGCYGLHQHELTIAPSILWSLQGGVIKGNPTAKPKIQKVPDTIANLTAICWRDLIFWH